DRSLLRELSACAWKAVRVGLRTALSMPKAAPGAVAALATAGDLASAHPHVHMLVSTGVWAPSRQRFRWWPAVSVAEHLTAMCRGLVLRMLTRRDRLAESTAERMLAWRHAGFDVWVGEPVLPWEVESRKRLARYLLKAPLSLERMRYDDQTCRVEYVSHKR